MKRITKHWLKKKNPCTDGFKWWCRKYGKSCTVEQFLKDGVDGDEWDYVKWLMPKLMTDTNNRKIAIYSASLVLPIFENEYSDDKRPRNAINAAKRYLKNPTGKNKELMRKANIAANTAAYAADSYYTAVYAAAYSASYSANAANAAAYAVDVYAASYATDAAANAADAVDAKDVISKILKYAIKINREEQA